MRAGRHSIRFAGRGFEVVAVDLSGSMLDTVNRKALAQGLELLTLQASVCRLACFPADTFDYALSMFSTLGMIRGSPARRKALPRRSGFSVPAAAWRCMCITSGSTCAILRVEHGSSDSSAAHSWHAPNSAIAA